jgi:hypothetical protein
MKENGIQDLLDVLLNKLFPLGVQLILPLLTSICLIVAFYKLKSLAAAGIHQSLNHISYAVLCFALYIIVPILIAPILVFLGGDAFENYIEVTFNGIAFLLAGAATALLFKAVSLA